MSEKNNGLVESFYMVLDHLKKRADTPYDKKNDEDKNTSTDIKNAFFNVVCKEVIKKANLPVTAIEDPDRTVLKGDQKTFRPYLWFRITTQKYKDYAFCVNIFADKGRNDRYDKFEQGYRIEISQYIYRYNKFPEHKEVNDIFKERAQKLFDKLNGEDNPSSNKYDLYNSNGSSNNYEFGLCLRKSFPVGDDEITKKDKKTVNDTIDSMGECLAELFAYLENDIYCI